MEHSECMDTKMDYSKYSFDELIDIKENIDKEAYPERYDSVIDILKVKYSYEEPSENRGPHKAKIEFEPYKLSDCHPSYLLKNLKLRIFCFLIVLASFNLLDSANEKGSVYKNGTNYEKGSMIYNLKTFKWEIILIFGVIGMVYPYHLHKK
jgi:hypothetical protein